MDGVDAGSGSGSSEYRTLVLEAYAGLEQEACRGAMRDLERRLAEEDGSLEGYTCQVFTTGMQFYPYKAVVTAVLKVRKQEGWRRFLKVKVSLHSPELGAAILEQTGLAPNPDAHAPGPQLLLDAHTHFDV